MDQRTGWRIAHKYEKKSLLFAINCVAALSIFFFGTYAWSWPLGPPLI